MNKIKNAAWFRTAIQIFFFLLIILIVLSKTLDEKGISLPFIQSVSLHSVCPFGGIETAYTYFTDGILIQKIHSSSIILMYIIFFLAILFGPVFCGWVCPFGTFQEFIGKIGRKIFPNKYNKIIPKKLDNVLRYLRYIILALVIYNTAVTAKLIFQNVDPYYALFNMFTGEVAISAYIALAVVVIASLFVERPFCKYMCPYGAVLGTFNLFRIFKIKRNENSCISCQKCDDVCPMNIEVLNSKTVINHQCISCLKCTSENVCPVNETVSVKAGRKSINQKIVGISLLVIFFGTILITSVFGVWETTSTKVPTKYQTEEYQNEYDPSDIRGSYTFGEISELFEIPLDDLAYAFGLFNVKDIESFKCKDLESVYIFEDGREIGTDSVRIFVAFYNGLPIVLNDSTYLPYYAENILLQKGNMSDEQMLFLSKHLIQP